MAAAPNRIWPQLPPEVAARVLSVLDKNELATSFRLVSKAAAAQLRDPEHTTVRLSHPVPPHAFAAKWLAPGATRGLTLAQRRRLLCLTAASGVLANMEIAVQAAGGMPLDPVFEAAASAGQLHICKWLRARGCFADSQDDQFPMSALSAAAVAGREDICEWLLDECAGDCEWSWFAVAAAAAGGHVALMEWLVQNRRDDDGPPPLVGNGYYQYIDSAAWGCDLATVQRLWRGFQEDGVDNPDLLGEVLAAAAASPTPDWQPKVEWLESVGCGPTCLAAAKAAACPDAGARLAWLRDRGYPFDASAVAAAAGAGNETALQCLLAGMRPPDDQTAGNAAAKAAVKAAAKAAAAGGHQAVLQALREAGWSLNVSSVMKAAAQGGHLHLLIWVWEELGRSKERLLTAELFTAAAESGSVEMLAWLQDRPCKMSQCAWEAGAKAGCVAALEWLKGNDCPMPLPAELQEHVVSFMDRNEVATSFRQVDKATAAMFRALEYTTVRLSQPVPPRAFAAKWLAPGAARGLALRQREQLLCLTASSGVLQNLEVAVTVLRAAGYPLTATAFAAAAAAGRFHVCSWLREQNCPSTGALTAAAAGGHVHICEWLFAKGMCQDEALRFLLAEEMGIEPDNGHAARNATRAGHLAALQVLHDAGWIRAPDAVAASAAYYGHLHVLVWLEETLGVAALRLRPALLSNAAASGSVELMAWLRQRGCPWDEAAFTSAACSGCEVAVEWLVERGCPMPSAVQRMRLAPVNAPVLGYAGASEMHAVCCVCS
ncbi:hypothetical protein GPECTOR_11g242 [Gonium pectorale]|uniref:F-box domain-containing protein n=1 Tax=Gonium pectorale TaxID=33097 RepID=A0A150GR37_GONPE|nr:hypothetical protein GPECTOR_11g242 [Gonium pectorale]|eukprot:KXZ51800.1 hypothetical protein GPECTOR_11g242 [Gonium pectorale]